MDSPKGTRRVQEPLASFAVQFGQFEESGEIERFLKPPYRASLEVRFCVFEYFVLTSCSKRLFLACT
jgi:hypothetical protein